VGYYIWGGNVLLKPGLAFIAGVSQNGTRRGGGSRGPGTKLQIQQQARKGGGFGGERGVSFKGLTSEGV